MNRIRKISLMIFILLGIGFGGDCRRANAGAGIESPGTVYTLRLLGNNDIEISATYYSVPNVKTSYHTEWLCFSKYPSNQNPGTAQPKIEFAVGSSQNHSIRVNGSFSTDTFIISGEKLIDEVRKWYRNDDALFKPEGITVYLSDIFVLKTRKTESSPWQIDHNGPRYDSLKKIQEAAEWSETTKKGFCDYYDAEICIRFHTGDYEIRRLYVDEKQKTVGNECLKSGKGLISETIDFSELLSDTAMLKNEMYRFSGKTLCTTEKQEPKAADFIRNDAGNEILLQEGKTILWLLYGKERTEEGKNKQENTEGKITPIPSPTPIPVPVLPVDDSVKPGYQQEGWEYYFSTEEGYTIESIQKKSYGYSLAFSVNGVLLSNNSVLNRDCSYAVGNDDAGNLWYFLENGNYAEMVHPAVYRGKDMAKIENIAEITELVFPETIYRNNKKYTVTEIGGGTAGYHIPDYTSNVSDAVSRTALYRPEHGEFDNYVFIAQNDGFYSKDSKAEYLYGVLGNGKILSSESVTKMKGMDADDKVLLRNYYVYNTTLEKVVIPATVTKIAEGAFYGCQALREIEGGEGILNIEREAFCGGHRRKTCISEEYSDSLTTIRKYYYFNESFSKTSDLTPRMQRWEQQVQLSKEFRFPSPNCWKNAEYIEVLAFAYHPNLTGVDLGRQLKRIGYYAFAYDNLPEIIVENPKLVIDRPPYAESTEGYLTLSNSVRNEKIYYEKMAENSENENQKDYYEKKAKKYADTPDCRTLVISEETSTAREYAQQWETYYRYNEDFNDMGTFFGRIDENNREWYQGDADTTGMAVVILDDTYERSDFWVFADVEISDEEESAVQREVCFPFDVWEDRENDGFRYNDCLCESGEWIEIGKEGQRFYIPVSTKVGIYEVNVRARNIPKEEKPEERTEEERIIGNEVLTMLISGRLYDFTVERIDNNPLWKNVNTQYTVGTKKADGTENGNNILQTLPFREGVHPTYLQLGALYEGDRMEFSVKSIGEIGKRETLEIVPSFYYVENDSYREVDFYYIPSGKNSGKATKWEPDSHKTVLTDVTEAQVHIWKTAFDIPKVLYTEKDTDFGGNESAKNSESNQKDTRYQLVFSLKLISENGEVLYYGRVPYGRVWCMEADMPERQDVQGRRYPILGGETAVILPGNGRDREFAIHGVY